MGGFERNSYNKELMCSIDMINQQFGKGTIRLASEQQSKRWTMRHELLSPRYTTQWRDTPRVLC